MMSLTFAFAAPIFVALLLAAVYVTALSRHRKGATGHLLLLERMALVETTLQPEGSVLIEGELWRARSRDGVRVERGQSVHVVGTDGHLLEVAPVPLALR